MRGDYDSAIRDCTIAIELDPTYAKAYNNRGIVLLDKHLPDAAIADFTKAIELDPFYEKAYSNRALAHAPRAGTTRSLAIAPRLSNWIAAISRPTITERSLTCRKACWAQPFEILTKPLGSSRITPPPTAYGERLTPGRACTGRPSAIWTWLLR